MFAAFNIADGTVISELHRRHRAIEFKKFLTAIDKAVPAELDVHLVCDNYATCNTPEIRAWLARRPRFHVHFTPAGSSWMNQVEVYFSVIQRKLLTPDDFTDLDALASQIQAFEQHYNAAARPFDWKFTRADLNRLLTRLARHDPAPPPPLAACRTGRVRRCGS